MPVAATHEDAVLVNALQEWLPARLHARSVEVEDLTRPQGGASAEKCVFAAQWEDAEGRAHQERFVLRIEPGEHSLFHRPDAVLEARVLQAIAASSGSVPGVLAVEPSAEPIGSPFYVMEFIDGRVLSDIPSCHVTGWLTELTPAERATHWDNALRVLAELGQIPAERGLEFLAVPAAGTNLAGLIAATREWYDWAAQGRKCGVIDDAMRHVEVQMPPHEDAFLSWGDARIGNMIFAPDGTVAGALDWEMAALGPAEVDLGWWLMMDEFYSTGLGVDPLPGFPDEQAQVRRWQQLIGRPARNLDYYKILAALRFAIIHARGFDRFADKGLLAPDSAIYTRNPAGLMLYRWLGEPVPELAPEYAAILDAYSAGQL
jgi:aminoglycoside phosphotransferase (APT) family kinase protein